MTILNPPTPGRPDHPDVEALSEALCDWLDRVAP